MKELVGKMDLTSGKIRVRKAIKNIADSRAIAAATAAGAMAGESLKSFAEKGVGLASVGYEKTGAKAVIGRAGEKFDEVSGRAILEEVRAMVEKQAFYNDVLASKLQEALDRIAELEARMNQP
jgi:hypothetical protein